MDDNSHIIIRTARLTDAGKILAIYEYYVKNTAITFEYEVPSLEEFRGRIENTLKRYPYLVLEVEGVIAGYAYAGPLKTRAAYDWCCEMTIYLDHKLQGQGYGRIMYDALEQRLKAMGICNLYACIGYPDREDEYLTRNSAQFHEHLGYRQNGIFHNSGYKFDRWYDMIWMEKIIGEHGHGMAAPEFGMWAK